MKIAAALTALLIAACSSEAEPPSLDPALAALLAQYGEPGTLTGSCRWHSAHVTPVNEVTGSLGWPDEHNPLRFRPRQADAERLPKEARYSAVLAFNRANGVEQRALSIEGDLTISGKVVIGQLVCGGSVVGNSSYDAAILVDNVVPAKPASVFDLESTRRGSTSAMGRNRT